MQIISYKFIVVRSLNPEAVGIEVNISTSECLVKIKTTYTV